MEQYSPRGFLGPTPYLVDTGVLGAQLALRPNSTPADCDLTEFGVRPPLSCSHPRISGRSKRSEPTNVGARAGRPGTAAVGA